jgi:hypothetical protein
MNGCRLTFTSGDSVEVQGDLDAVIEELHKVATRREHTFARLLESSGAPVAVRPDGVLTVRPLEAREGLAESP